MPTLNVKNANAFSNNGPRTPNRYESVRGMNTNNMATNNNAFLNNVLVQSRGRTKATNTARNANAVVSNVVQNSGASTTNNNAVLNNLLVRSGATTAPNISPTNNNNALSPIGRLAFGYNNAAGNRPLIRYGNNGRLVNDNFAPKPALPPPTTACQASLRGDGLRGTAFQKCFVDHLRSTVGPMMAAANAAVGNATKMNAMCTQAAIAPHQIVVYEIAKLMSVVPTENLGDHRGLLAFHNTGSGKSVTSLAVIMAYWHSDKRIILVSSKVNTAQAMETYKREASRFFPEEYRAIVDEYKKRKLADHLSDKEAFDDALMERVRGLTFVEARNRIAAKQGEFKTIKDMKLYSGAGSVLIIDEAQGLAMKSRSDPNGDAIKLGCALRGLSKDKMRKVHVFAMTATPGNSVREWMRLLSVVRRADQMPFTHDNDSGSNSKGRVLCEHRKMPAGWKDWAARVEMDLAKGSMAWYPAFSKEVFGLVSYVDIRSDRSRHACVSERDMKMELDRYYFLLMLRENAGLRRRVKSVADKAQHRYDPKYPDAFMKRMRLLGNSLPGTVWKTLPKQEQEELVRRRRILRVNSTSEGRYVSNKMIGLAQSLAQIGGKHYVYTVQGNEYILAAGLRQWYQMKDVTKLFDTFDNGAMINKNKGTVSGISKGNNLVVLGDQTTKEHKERITSFFNSPANADGSYIRIVIATGQLYEGLDLAGLRYVHLCDPLPSPLQEVQAVGRGVRNCSHRLLPVQNRRVTVVRWYSASPSGGWQQLESLLGGMKGMRGRIGVEEIKQEYDRLNAASPTGRPRGYDEFVSDRSKTDPSFLVLHNFERGMKSAAIDCQVLSKYHSSMTCGMAPAIVNKVSLLPGTLCNKPKTS